MNRLAALIALTSLTTTLAACNGPLIGTVSFNMGGSDAPLLKDDAGPVNNGCPAYHQTPDAMKAFLTEHNDADPTLNPWAGWLLDLRVWLESGCP